MSSQDSRVTTKAPKIQRTSRAPRRHSTRWLRCIRCIHRTRFVCVWDDGRKSTLDVITRLLVFCRTNRPNSISLHPGNDGGRSKNCTTFQSQNVHVYHPRHEWPISWSGIEDPVVPLDRNLYGHPVGGLLWERQLEEVPLELGWWSRRTNMISWPRMFGMHSKWMPTERNYYYWEQRNVRITNFCRSNRKITRMGKTSCEDGGVVSQHGRTCSKTRGKFLRIGKRKDRATIRSLKLPPWMIITSRRRAWISWRIVESMLTDRLEMLVFGTSRWTDILWSVNNLSRSVTIWTRACDRRLTRLISYIHHTSDHRQCRHVGKTAQQCRPSSFQDSGFVGDFEDSTLTSGGILFIFGCRTFVFISWMCEKQTSASHSSTESEIILLDSLPMNGILALDLCVARRWKQQSYQRAPKPCPRSRWKSRQWTCGVSDTSYLWQGRRWTSSVRCHRVGTPIYHQSRRLSNFWAC